MSLPCQRGKAPAALSPMNSGLRVARSASCILVRAWSRPQRVSWEKAYHCFSTSMVKWRVVRETIHTNPASKAPAVAWSGRPAAVRSLKQTSLLVVVAPLVKTTTLHALAALSSSSTLSDSGLGGAVAPEGGLARSFSSSASRRASRCLICTMTARATVSSAVTA